IVGTVDGKKVALGNPALLAESAIDAGELAARAEELRRGGQTVMFVAVENRLAGLLGVSDPIKPTTPEAIRALNGDAARVVMLTGDSRTTAAAVAKNLGVDDFQSEVLPEENGEAVKRLQARGRIVAMGTGTAVAIESAGITLVQGDLRGIVKARRLSRATMRNIRQNLFFAFFYNMLGVPIAAGVLYPFFGILLSPVVASAAMTFSSVSVIMNALRLNKVDL